MNLKSLFCEKVVRAQIKNSDDTLLECDKWGSYFNRALREKSI